MKKTVFDCEIITSMFLYGADGKTPELRAPSFKGAMRFWWRAIQAEENIENMRKIEASIFGDSEIEGRSKLTIRIKGQNKIEWQKILPHHTGDRNCPYLPGCASKKNPNYCSKGFSLKALKEQRFQITFVTNNFPENFSEEKLKALFKITAFLGGVGKRSRRGFGSFSIVSGSEKSDSLDYLLNLLDVLVKGNFVKEQNSIILNKPCAANYPFIRQVELGRVYSTVDQLLKTIGRASHEAAAKYPYDKSLGYVHKSERLASPVYVSVIKSKNGYRPVVTTLNMSLKEKNIYYGEKQKYFKEAIL